MRACMDWTNEVETWCCLWLQRACRWRADYSGAWAAHDERCLDASRCRGLACMRLSCLQAGLRYRMDTRQDARCRTPISWAGWF